MFLKIYLLSEGSVLGHLALLVLENCLLHDTQKEERKSQEEQAQDTSYKGMPPVTLFPPFIPSQYHHYEPIR